MRSVLETSESGSISNFGGICFSHVFERCWMLSVSILRHSFILSENDWAVLYHFRNA